MKPITGKEEKAIRDAYNALCDRRGWPAWGFKAVHANMAKAGLRRKVK